jgi:hypothetical protein
MAARDFSHGVGKFALPHSLKTISNLEKSRQTAGIGVAG